MNLWRLRLGGRLLRGDGIMPLRFWLPSDDLIYLNELGGNMEP